jgi:peptidylprolyl isomerase
MATANFGNTVKVHYTVKLDDGTVVDSTLEHGPFTFTLGMGQVIPGFEEAVTDMSPGTSKTAQVDVEDAYGQYYQELIKEVDKNKFPDGFNFEAGQRLEIPAEDGKSALVTVVGTTETTVILDTNHPLAGKNLMIDIQLLEILGQ